MLAGSLSAQVAGAAQLPNSQQQQYPEAQSAPQTLYSMSGRIVNAETGEGIARALVLCRYAGGSTNYGQRSMMTDALGSFHFEGMPAGQYAFSAQKPGYFEDGADGRRSFRQQMIEVGPAGAATVTVKLMPEAIIAGRVVDERGEPVEGLPVRLLTRQIMDGHLRWQPVGGSMTKEDGDFRIANLRPGQYYLHYGPRWREDLFTPPEKELGYAQGYYPNSANISAAAPVQARGGQTTELELAVRQTRGIAIEGEIVGAAEGGGMNCRAVDEDAMDAMVGGHGSSDAQHFSLRVGAPGIYTVKCAHYGEPGTESFGQLRVNAERNVKGLRLVMSPLATVVVNVVRDAVKPAQGIGIGDNGNPIQMRLRSMDAEHQDYWSQADAKGKGQTMIRGIEPGAYMLDTNGYGQWYVASATYRGREAWREPVEIGAGGTGELDVVLRDDGGTINGTFEDAGAAANQSWSVLIVDESRPQLPRVQQEGGNGQFSVSGLAPGRYRLYAFTGAGATQVEYANPAALELYASGSQSISIGAGEQKTVKLSAMEVAP